MQNLEKMIIYSITVKLFPEIRPSWVKWMNEVHVPEMMKTGFFIECRMCKVLEEDESQGVTYNLQYLCENYSKLMEYKENHAAVLEKKHDEKYEGKFVIFKTMLKLKGAFRP